MGRVDPGYYFVTSAPQIVRGRIILGGWVTDGQFVGEPSGVVRAFDAVSGRLSWAFDIGHPHRRGAPPEGESYTPGSPNSWAPMSVDEDRGLDFVPTGKATTYTSRGHRFDREECMTVVAISGEAVEGELMRLII